MREAIAQRRHSRRAGASTFADDPDRPAWQATILFRASVDAGVLPVLASPPDKSRQTIDLAALGCRIDMVEGEAGCQHILLHDGPSRLRLDVVAGSLLEGAASIRILVDRLDRADWTWDALCRLRQSIATGRLARRPMLSSGRLERSAIALRAWDARQSGASHRDLAALLVGPARVREEWRSHTDYLRSRVRRVLRAADRMIAGGWRDLLGPPKDSEGAV